MRYIDSLMRHAFSRCRCLFVVLAILSASSLAWGEVEATAGSEMGKPEVASVAVKVEADEERKMFNDEPREMSGIVAGSIVVNLTLVVVFFTLLWKEWNKHKVVPKSGSNNQSEGE